MKNLTRKMLEVAFHSMPRRVLAIEKKDGSLSRNRENEKLFNQLKVYLVSRALEKLPNRSILPQNNF